MKKQKTKKVYPENARSLAGFFFTPFTATFGAMAVANLGLFLTDYAGIDSALGKPGFAAAFATLFIIITRVIDVVDDPVQSWILDSAKENKFGKYRTFGIFGIILITLGTIMLYGIPGGVKNNVVLLWAWAIIGYLIMESGSAFGSIATPIMQKATNEPRIRSKIAAVMRMGCVFAAIPIMFYVPVISLVGSKTGNLGKAASLVTVSFCVLFCFISFIGLALLKEPYREKIDAKMEKIIGFAELKELVTTDIPLWVHCIALFIGQLATGIGTGCMLHYIKWNYCADVLTGEVDLIKFAGYASIISIVGLIPNFLCPFLLTLVLKLFKSVDGCMRGCYIIEAVAFGLITILQFAHLLNPVLLIALLFVINIPAGISAMMMTLITMECADYAEYKVGRNMTALVNSIYNIANKASSIIGGAVPGFMFAIVGYSVNELTGAYAGAMETFPRLLTGLKMLIGPAPVILALSGYFIYRLFYKITPEFRESMREELNQRHKEMEGITERQTEQ